MSQCNGAPAEQWLEQYVAGILPEWEAQAFEEHYFDCPVCLGQLQAVQAVAAQMRINPVKLPARVLSWRITATIGAVAAMLLISVILYRSAEHRMSVAANQPSHPAPTSSGQPAALATQEIAQIADLNMPAFTASSLRGEAEDANYRAGMRAYVGGDCSVAVDRLARVSQQSAEALSAQFYSGACQLKLNQLDAAFTTLGRVAGRGDSPQEEAALYYLAQISLLRADSDAARQNLAKVIALRGEFEQRARDELKKLSEASAGKQ